MNHADSKPIILTRKEAIAEGAVLDLAEIAEAKDLLVQLGFTMPVAITYSAHAEPFEYRTMLLALKSVLRFALYQGETTFRVPLKSSDHESVWLKALREVEESQFVLTIMTLDEGATRSLYLTP